MLTWKILPLLLALLARGVSASDYRTTWIGNTFGGSKWVQINIAAMYVAPDGTCFTNSFWDESGHEAGIYRQGDVIGACDDLHGHGGYAVTADDHYVYVAYRMNELRSGVRRYDRRSGKPVGSVLCDDGFVQLTRSPFSIRGLAVIGSTLCATDFEAGKVHLISTRDLAPTGQFPIQRPERIVAAADTLWVSQASDAAHPAAIVHLSAEGKSLGQQINDVVAPTAIAMDGRGRLLVADNGPDQQVRIYQDLDSSPKCVATVGEKGGIFSGVRGRVGPLRFNGITGVGVDSAGNLMISQNGIGPCYRDENGFGNELRCLTPDGALRWELHGLEFVDIAEPDPASDTDLFTRCQHFVLDHKATSHSAWSYRDSTLDRLRFPEDPRIHLPAQCVLAVRRIHGSRLLYLTDMSSRYVVVYRFEPGSEMAIPCVMFARDHVKEGFPSCQPASGDWIWRDSNGDGRFSPDEFDVHEGDNLFVWGWSVDSDGTVWKANREDGIRRFPVQRLDERGAPVYSYSHSESIANPAPFDRRDGYRGDIDRVEYDPAGDVMYLTGYTAEHRNNDGAWGNVGPVICRYDGWSKGNRTAHWSITPPYDNSSREPILDRAMSIAGDYLFLTYQRHPKVLAFDLRSGKAAGELTPGDEVDRASCGWVDIPYGIKAFRRAGGEYLIFNEEDARGKVILYRWRPCIPESGKRQSPTHHIEFCSEFHLARTEFPTEVMAAIAPTTINPAIRAYSRTSPPDSSIKIRCR